MPRRGRLPQVAGAGLGLALAVLTVGLTAPPARAPLLPDCEGALAEVVLHHMPGWEAVAGDPYRQLLARLPAEVTVRVVCPDPDTYASFLELVGPVRCQVAPVVTGHPVTGWARDRWLALGSGAGPEEPISVLSPRQEALAGTWPARAGDAQVGRALAAACPGRVHARRSRLLFDGGDIVADDETAFVMPRVLRRNRQAGLATRGPLVTELGETLGRRIVLLEEAPDYHAGMFMMVAGDRRVIVGDPGLAGRGAWPEVQRQLDAMAAQCLAAGYDVHRIPLVPAGDGRTYLTYTNVLVDMRGERRTVYLPVYRDAGPLNGVATDVWEGLGYEVVPVDCSTVYRHFGSLRCLVNVLRRAPAAGPRS
jgi:hypothetical protein